MHQFRPASLGFQETFDQLTDRTFATTQVRYDMGNLFQFFRRIGHTGSQSDVLHYGQVGKVIPDKTNFVRRNTKIADQLLGDL